MTLAELAQALASLGYPVTYYQFELRQTPPFIVYLNPRDNSFSADNRVIYKSKNVHVEVYTSKKDLSVEATVEKLFTDNEIFYDVDEVYIDSEEVFKRTYYITI
jgi:hypothetical protein